MKNKKKTIWHKFCCDWCIWKQKQTKNKQKWSRLISIIVDGDHFQIPEQCSRSVLVPYREIYDLLLKITVKELKVKDIFKKELSTHHILPFFTNFFEFGIFWVSWFCWAAQNSKTMRQNYDLTRFFENIHVYSFLLFRCWKSLILSTIIILSNYILTKCINFCK